MSQFRSRFQSPPQKPQTREVDVRLRTQGESYGSEQDPSPYGRRQVETQKLKNLSFWSNSDKEGGEEEEWIERQSPTPFILGIIILVVACTLLWFLFRWASGENTNTPPIIAADTAPFKVRPENPGGMMIPHQDKLVYGRLTQGAPQPIERLLPPPEQPMAAAPPMAQPMGAPQMNTPQQQQPYPQQQGYVQPQQGYAPNPAMQQGVQLQPNPQQPQSYPPFQSQAPYPQQQPAPSLQGQQYQSQPLQGQPMQPMQGQPSYPMSPQSQAPYGPPAPQPAVMPQSPQISQNAPTPDSQNHISEVEGIKPAQDEDDAEDKSDRGGQSDLDRLIAREANAPLKQSTKKKDEKVIHLMPIDPAKHKVQIASLPSRPMAEQEMKRLRRNYSSLFQNKRWNIQRVNLGVDRGFTHRLVVGSFSNHEAAAKFCKKLRSEKIGCLVVAPAKE